MIGVVKRQVVATLYEVRIGNETIEAIAGQKFFGKHRISIKVGDTVEVQWLNLPCFTKPFIVRRLPASKGGSGLPHLHLAATENQTMNSAEKIINHYGLNSDSQGNAGWIHGLLALLASDYEGGDTHPNPCREILLRLESRGVNQHVRSAVQAFSNSYEVAFDAGKAS